MSEATSGALVAEELPGPHVASLMRASFASQATGHGAQTGGGAAATTGDPALRLGREGLHFISATTGAGLDGLISALVQFAERSFTLEPAVVTHERQRVTLEAVVRALDGAIRHAEANAGEELVAEDLRHAATQLGRLTGRVDVEDILDVIFREFCVGK